MKMFLCNTYLFKNFQWWIDVSSFLHAVVNIVRQEILKIKSFWNLRCHLSTIQCVYLYIVLGLKVFLQKKEEIQMFEIQTEYQYEIS